MNIGLLEILFAVNISLLIVAILEKKKIQIFYVEEIIKLHCELNSLKRIVAEHNTSFSDKIYELSNKAINDSITKKN